jgi:hypothetical protein
MDLPELLQALREHAEKGEEQQKEVVSGLSEHVPQVHQVVFNAGFARAKDKAKGEHDELQGQLAEAQSKAQELQEQLEASGGGSEQVEELQRKVAHWKGEAEKLQRAVEEKDEEWKSELRSRDRKMALQDLRGRLSRQLHEEYAARLVRDPEVADRVQVLEDGSTEVLQDGSDVPITVPEGKDPLDVLAAELYKSTPAALRKAEGDRGSGIEGGSGGGGSNRLDQRFLEASRKRRESRPNPLAPQQQGGSAES